MTVSQAATLRKSQMFAACWDVAQHRLIIMSTEIHPCQLRLSVCVYMFTWQTKAYLCLHMHFCMSAFVGQRTGVCRWSIYVPIVSP